MTFVIHLVGSKRSRLSSAFFELEILKAGKFVVQIHRPSIWKVGTSFLQD